MISFEGLVQQVILCHVNYFPSLSVLELKSISSLSERGVTFFLVSDTTACFGLCMCVYDPLVEKLHEQ
jgi:hypothetical protein